MERSGKLDLSNLRRRGETGRRIRFGSGLGPKLSRPRPLRVQVPPPVPSKVTQHGRFVNIFSVLAGLPVCDSNQWVSRLTSGSCSLWRSSTEP